jgi:hypothetical protein
MEERRIADKILSKETLMKDSVLCSGNRREDNLQGIMYLLILW